MRLLMMCCALAAAACGDLSTAESNLSRATPTVTAPPILSPTIAYVVTPDTVTEDIPIFRRAPGGVPAVVGMGQRVYGTADLLVAMQRRGLVTLTRAADGAPIFASQDFHGNAPDVVRVADTVYAATFDRLAAIDRAGVTRWMTLPTALPTTVGPCELTKANVNMRDSGLRAFAAAQGHLFVYVATLGNGAVVDVMDGRRLDLVDAGAALAMTTGSDGKLYVATIDGRCRTNHLIVRRIDPTTLVQERAIDTGRVLPFQAIHLVATRTATYVHLVLESTAELLRIDDTNVKSMSLPNDSGLLDAVAPDGTIYLFGGRARRFVTRFDPRTATVTRVDDAQGPDGSFVEAVFF